MQYIHSIVQFRLNINFDYQYNSMFPPIHLSIRAERAVYVEPSNRPLWQENIKL